MRTLYRLFLLGITIALLNLCGCDESIISMSAELTPEEQEMPEARYYNTEFAVMPDDVADAVAAGPVDPDAILAFEDIAQLTEPGYLDTENGYCRLDDRTGFVAARTDMPGVTKDMVQWWFWWHTVKDIRYKIWCPGAHYAIGAEDMDRMTDDSLSPEERYLYNTNYPVEDVGFGKAPLAIEFVEPETFGLDPSTFEENGVEMAICGIVSLKLNNVYIDHTYMCHLFRKKGDGLELRSRFWLGKAFRRPIMGVVITENTALDMMLHCTQEFNHLAGFLPEIYAEFSGNP